QLLGYLSLLAAYGLWKRWRFVRLILLGLSWWCLFASAILSAAALATFAGLLDKDGLDEPTWETLAEVLVACVIEFWQIWVLTRPAVRDSRAGESCRVV